MKREAELKSQFRKTMHRMLPSFYLLEYATNGAPDREIVGNGISTRWEFKHATPTFKSPLDQELTCCRLAAAAHCRYVIWWESGPVQRTMIVHPLHVHKRTDWTLTEESGCAGFDMAWLVDQVRKAHGR